MPIPRHASSVREHGFTLLEVLVSVALVMLVVPVLVASQIKATKLGEKSDLHTGALRAAESKMEELRLDGYGRVVAGNDTVLMPSGGTLARVWTVTEDVPVVGARRITVSARRVESDVPETVTLFFVLGRR